jgi:hypothetical protein
LRVIAMLLLAANIAPAPTSADPATDTHAPAPRVRVVATQREDDTASSLYDWLVVRLLEEGYAVAGGDGAEIDLTIWPTEHHGWTVRAHGKTSENFSVSIGDDEAVARLELLHRAVDALASVEPRERTESADDKAFAIELAPTIADDRRAQLESDIALAVLDGGGSLAPHRNAASYVMCAAPEGEGTRIEVVEADAPCPVPSGAAADLPPPGDQTQSLVHAVLLGKQDAPAPAAEVVQARESERAPSENRYPAGPARRSWKNPDLVLRGGAAVGVVGRLIEPNLSVVASMLIGREPGVSLWLDLQMWPTPVRRDLFVFETVPTVGMRVRAFTEGRFSFDLGVLVGIQTHSYRFDDGTTRDHGLALDFSGEAAAGFAVNLWRHHELQFLFRAGSASRERVHELPGRFPIWQRAAPRVGCTLGLSFGRNLRS